jgi:TfoX/Sxy family transcriptional regulator of competence genes
MVYDEILAGRVRALLGGLPGLGNPPGFTEKKMFGGVAFLMNGNMACGISKTALIVRVGPAHYSQALHEPFTSEFDITGRPMRGWVSVSPDGCRSEADLFRWIKRGVTFARSLPPK